MPSNSRHRKRRAATVFGEKYADRDKAPGESRFFALMNKRDRELNNQELNQLCHFSTATNLASGLHLPFFGTGYDWLASALKEMPRNRSPEVLTPTKVQYLLGGYHARAVGKISTLPIQTVVPIQSEKFLLFD